MSIRPHMPSHSTLILDFFEALRRRNLTRTQTLLMAYPDLARAELTDAGPALLVAFYADREVFDRADPAAFLQVLEREAKLDEILLQAGAPVDAAEGVEPPAEKWGLLMQMVHQLFAHGAQAKEGQKNQVAAQLMRRLDVWLRAFPESSEQRWSGLTCAWIAWDKALQARHADVLAPIFVEFGHLVMIRLLQIGQGHLPPGYRLTKDETGRQSHHAWVHEAQLRWYRANCLNALKTPPTDRRRSRS